ncbi:hypothetical protein SAMN05421594_2467 [Chryseobacterium oleae]|uniref:Acetyltransferase (GNAT) domain-containing protein n=1 Tax=Chryseobacterium oleae TaxID=491207 RepID=A0A1I4YJS7_CHROL|nr:hypothetical protein [Chryseobacterium oleae]SFN38264.1 hypothetical protein SAMN05421594_2467 [Chryseobacterium oleae]
MIRRVKYNQIDFEKYTECLENSVQRNWYSQKRILDQLSGNWHVLIYKDYEAVMPIHIYKKFGINFVHMPLFCQQLGVFSKADDPKINDAFLYFLKKNYTVFLYLFNQDNTFSTPLQKKKNYVIPISDYSVLKRKKYFKGRKSTIKASQHLIYKEIEFDEQVMLFFKNNFKGLTKEADWIKLKIYILFLLENNVLKFCGSYFNDSLINLAVLIKDEKQFSLLSLINDEDYKAENGASFLIDKILSLYIHEKSLNFMGSNIRGIEVFFKSFGAELHEYGFIENKFLKRFS